MVFLFRILVSNNSFKNKNMKPVKIKKVALKTVKGGPSSPQIVGYDLTKARPA